MTQADDQGKQRKDINALLIATHTCMVLIQQISNKAPTRHRVCMQKNVKRRDLYSFFYIPNETL
jgi:hypothetical protein